MDIMNILELLGRPAVLSAITAELSGMGYRSYNDEFVEAARQFAKKTEDLMELIGNYETWFANQAKEAEETEGKESRRYDRWKHRADRLKPFSAWWGRYKYKLIDAMTELGQQIRDEVIAANREEYNRYMQDEAIDKARRYLDNIPVLEELEAEWEKDRQALLEKDYELDEICRTGCREKIYTGSPFDPLCPVDKYGNPTCGTRRAQIELASKIRKLDGRYYGKIEELGQDDWVTDPAEEINTYAELYPQFLYGRWKRNIYKDKEAYEAGKRYYAELFRRLGMENEKKEILNETWEERQSRQNCENGEYVQYSTEEYEEEPEESDVSEEPEENPYSEILSDDEIEQTDDKTKRAEIIEKYREQLTDSMKRNFRAILNCHGRICYDFYIWSDGEIEVLQQVPGGHGFLKKKDWEDRDLYYVCRIEENNYDPWEHYPESIPEDEEEAEAVEQEIIDCDMEFFDPDDILDEVIRQDACYEED